jgi:hypothetical protein
MRTLHLGTDLARLRPLNDGIGDENFRKCCRSFLRSYGVNCMKIPDSYAFRSFENKTRARVLCLCTACAPVVVPFSFVASGMTPRVFCFITACIIFLQYMQVM